MYQISKRFQFDAAHHLPHLPSTHKCSRPHGHTYSVTVVLRSETLDEHGFVKDYGDLGQFKQLIDDQLDHRDLNDVFSFPTTAENLAEELYEWAQHIYGPIVYAIVVRETPSTSAVYWQSSGEASFNSMDLIDLLVGESDE